MQRQRPFARLKVRSGACLQKDLLPVGIWRVQLDATGACRELSERERVPLVGAVRKALQLIPAEFVSPGVFLARNVRDLEANMVACRPGSDILQEVAQGLCSGEQLVGASLSAGVVACRGQAELPVLGREAVLGHHGQCELRERLKTGNIGLRPLSQLGVVPAHLWHAPLLREPAEIRGRAYPSSDANYVSICSRVRGGHAVQNWGLAQDHAGVPKAGVQPMQADAAVLAEVNLVSGWILHADPSFLVRARHEWDAGFVCDCMSGHFEDLSPERQPEACRRACYRAVRREGVEDMLQHVWVH